MVVAWDGSQARARLPGLSGNQVESTGEGSGLTGAWGHYPARFVGIDGSPRGKAARAAESGEIRAGCAAMEAGCDLVGAREH